MIASQKRRLDRDTTETAEDERHTQPQAGAPFGHRRVLFVNSGKEAMMAAKKTTILTIQEKKGRANRSR
jgi:hypothetical protein